MARTRSAPRTDAPTADRLDLPDHAAPSKPTLKPTDKRLITKYDPDTVADILCAMASGVSLRRACAPHDIAPPTLLRWVRENEPVGIAEQYARAREQQAHALADGVIDMAMDESAKADPNLLRVRLDAAKWAAARILPKVYGDRIDVSANVNASVRVGWVIDLTPETPVLDGTAVDVSE